MQSSPIFLREAPCFSFKPWVGGEAPAGLQLSEGRGRRGTRAVWLQSPRRGRAALAAGLCLPQRIVPSPAPLLAPIHPVP